MAVVRQSTVDSESEIHVELPRQIRDGAAHRASEYRAGEAPAEPTF
jgi:hypothetical protein